MNLTKIHVKEFQSILDSGEFEVGDITCLVGKNESGKTALLQALYRLHPIVQADGRFSITDDYPRWTVEDYRHDVESGKRQHATVVRAVFELNPEERRLVAGVIGENALKAPHLTLSKGYSHTLLYGLNVDVGLALKHLASRLPSSIKRELAPCKDLEAAIAAMAVAARAGLQ